MQEMGQWPNAIFSMARLGARSTSTRRGLLALTLLMILEDSNRRAEQARITYLMMMSYTWRNPEEHKLAYFGGHKFEENGQHFTSGRYGVPHKFHRNKKEGRLVRS